MLVFSRVKTVRKFGENANKSPLFNCDHLNVEYHNILFCSRAEYSNENNIFGGFSLIS